MQNDIYLSRHIWQVDGDLSAQQYWIWATGLSSWSKRLHNCHHVCPVSEPCVVQTVYQQLCQLIRGFYSPLFAVFWPQTDTGRTFHFPHTSCHSSGTTSRGENIYQPPGASSQDRQMWRVADWLGFIINIHHLHIYPISLVNSLGSLAELKTQCFTTMWTIESCKSWLYNRNGYSIQESCLVFFVLLLLTFLND